MGDAPQTPQGPGPLAAAEDRLHRDGLRVWPLWWVAQAAFLSGVVHAVLLYGVLGSVSTQAQVSSAPVVRSGPARLCEGDRRCPFAPARQKRRRLDDGPPPDIHLIEVALVPQLGMKEPQPKEMPKLVKYEQPEVIQDAINIEEEVVVEQPPPEQAPRPEKREVDKRRKPKDLADILDAPRDDDPRKRPTQLDGIIGSSDGSTYGSDPSPGEVNAVVARLQQELMRRFIVPSSLSDEELKKLQSRLRLQISDDGSIKSYKFARKSGNRGFDGAAEAAVKSFIPAEGGSLKLPEIPADIRAHLNAKGVFVFDGRYIRR